jgi:hypothetical protein
MIQNSKKYKNTQKKYYFVWSIHFSSLSLHHKNNKLLIRGSLRLLINVSTSSKKRKVMKNKEKGNLCTILGKAVGAIGAAASVALIS